MTVLLAERCEMAAEGAVAEVPPKPRFVHNAGPGFAETDGDPQCLEHMALAWEEEGKLPGYDLAPSDRQYVEGRLGPSGGVLGIPGGTGQDS